MSEFNREWFNSHSTKAKGLHASLSIFDYPIDYFPRNAVTYAEAAQPQIVKPAILMSHPETGHAGEVVEQRTLCCRLCAEIFPDIPRMRAHFKSEGHITNIRRGASEAAQQTLDDEQDGESGSDSDISEPEELDNSAQGSTVVAVQSFTEGDVRRTYDNIEGPRTSLRRAMDDFEVSFSNVAILKPQIEAENPWYTIQKSVEFHIVNPLWCVLSLRSGRFAGAIFDGSAIIAHKNFRRLLLITAVTHSCISRLIYLCISGILCAQRLEGVSLLTTALDERRSLPEQ
jgi:hypothetical protein